MRFAEGVFAMLVNHHYFAYSYGLCGPQGKYNVIVIRMLMILLFSGGFKGLAYGLAQIVGCSIYDSSQSC
jgi:hypothetical protein